MTHPTVEIDDVVRQRARLGILAIVSRGDRVEFGYLKAALENLDASGWWHAIGVVARSVGCFVEATPSTGTTLGPLPPASRPRTTPTAHHEEDAE